MNYTGFETIGVWSCSTNIFHIEHITFSMSSIRGPRGRGRGYQAQQGYHQLLPYTLVRNPGHPRGRGNQRFMHNSQRQPNPSPTPVSSSNIASNLMAEGESVQLTGFITKKSTAVAFEDRKRKRLTSNVPGLDVICCYLQGRIACTAAGAVQTNNMRRLSFTMKQWVNLNKIK